MGDRMDKRLTTPTVGGERTRLCDALPLDTPYLVQIFPCYACNFRCDYCIYALEPAKRDFISHKSFMDWSLFKKCIDDLKAFPRKLKMLRFAAIGEPLLHPEIARMVTYAAQSQVAESVDIVTNGSLLTHALSDALIAAGLSRLRISIEGLSSQDYWENSHAKVDFQDLVEQIHYFYSRSGSTQVYVKIIDYMVPGAEKQKAFYDLFQPICHSLAIEHLTPTIEGIDYGALAGDVSLDQTQNGTQLLDAEICPQPFYMMQINPDGLVVPCCSMKYPAVLGDVTQSSVAEIWNGADYGDFRRALLEGRAVASHVCEKCLLYRYDLHPLDVLDGARERLLARYDGGKPC